ncbi:MAG: TIR domain-containing protein [Steroidobacteraceae bacterium]
MSGIFISYRRSDNPDATGRIYDRLVSEFGKTRVFKDIDSIPLGQDFRGHLSEVIGSCSVVLAIIGERWTDARNTAGQRRLEDADDFVRIELEAALARGIPVVPVLVAHAAMPGPSVLPASLASMVFRQSIDVRPDPDFHNDATRLVSALRVLLDPNAPPVTEAKARSNGSLSWKIALAAAIAVAAALAIPAGRYVREVHLHASRVAIPLPVEDGPSSFALSPEGDQLVYIGSSDGGLRLWVRALSGITAQPLTGTEGAAAPFWSPDGRSVAFFAGGALKRLDLNGGSVQSLAAVGAADFAALGVWNGNGEILFSSTAGEPLRRIAASGGPVTLLSQAGTANGVQIPLGVLPTDSIFCSPRSPTTANPVEFTSARYRVDGLRG